MITEVQFATEFQEWNGRMIGSLRKKGFSQHSAEDITQNTWLKAWRFLEQFRGEAKFSTWVFNILMNEVKTHLRDKHAKHCEPIDNLDLLAAPVTDTDENERRLVRVLEDLEQLPEVFREVVRMRLLGFSDKEIASTTGLQIPAVKSRVFRGVRKLVQMKGSR